MAKRLHGVLLQSIVLERNSAQSLSTQLYQQLKTLLLNGVLVAGDRLPSTRTLSSELGVARTTVVEIFERLIVEGLLESRVGAGTRVSRALPAHLKDVPQQVSPPPVASARLAQAMERMTQKFAPRLTHQVRPFTTGLPSFDAFPMAQWIRLSNKHWRTMRQQVLGYPDPHGHFPLREAIATHLRINRGIVCDAAQIVIVGGAQYAFQLIAEMLLDEGDKVWFENPGHLGARNCFILAGAQLVPVPVDSAGFQVDFAHRAAPSFKLAFVTPAHQQPLGVTMSLERRFALLEAASASEAWVIEDDWVGEFCASEKPIPTLKEMDRGDRVIYVGSFSKSLFPSLRLGFILAPKQLMPFFHTNLEAFASSVPTCLQAILADFIHEGYFATHIRRMRKHYAERYEALVHAIELHLSHALEVAPTRTGLHTVAYLSPSLDAEKISQDAAQVGITLTPLQRFCLEPMARQGLTLGFAAYSPQQIEEAVIALKPVFARHRKPGHG